MYLPPFKTRRSSPSVNFLTMDSRSFWTRLKSIFLRSHHPRHQGPPQRPILYFPFKGSSRRISHHVPGTQRLQYGHQCQILQYLHGAAFSPVLKTWTKAIDAGFFTTWLGLTSDLVRKQLPKSLATAKCHLQQDQQNVRSTKPLIPDSDEPKICSHRVFTKVTKITGKVSTDQTGRFPITSSRGSK